MIEKFILITNEDGLKVNLNVRYIISVHEISKQNGERVTLLSIDQRQPNQPAMIATKESVQDVMRKLTVGGV